jgi:uncharacterized membrane protein YedE/YeeE
MGPIAVKPFLLCALLSGALFGAGLVVSGMTDPERVIGFLDIFGHFDPRLGFVFVEAVLVTIVTFRVALRMPKPLAAPRFELPSARQIDWQLLVGAAIFGIGWGIGGYCPGPAVAGLAVGSSEAIWFVSAMLAGSNIYRWATARKKLHIATSTA